MTVTDVADELERRATGCLAGAAIGDALGGPTEGHTPEAIQEVAKLRQLSGRSGL
jgi:ADP-ribosylglycohydrolase